MNVYRITDGKSIELKDILLQLKAIKEFPATLHIYDRAFVITNKEEMWALLHGIELGWYMAEEHEENNRPRVVSRAIDPEGFTGRVVKFEE